MPELPEVETMRRGVEPVCGGRIVRATRTPCRCRPIGLRPAWPALKRRVEGRRVLDVRRAGKRVVLVLDDGGRLVFQPRMSGLLLLADPPDREHLRLQFTVEQTGGPVHALRYWDRRGLGQVQWMDEAEYAAQVERVLGPDALTVTGEQLRQRLGAGRRAIKVALLDQHAVAGIGNLYAAEILFRVRLHPATPCWALRERDWERLAEATRQVLAEAVAYEGSTLGDGTYRNALNQEGNYQNHHRVYGRAGQPCPVCGAAIRRIVQAQRSTFFCPRCQRLRRAVRGQAVCKGPVRRR